MMTFVKPPDNERRRIQPYICSKHETALKTLHTQ